MLLAILGTLATGKAASQKSFAWVFCLLDAVTGPAVQCCTASSIAEGCWQTTVACDGWLLLLSVLLIVGRYLNNRHETLNCVGSSSCSPEPWLASSLMPASTHSSLKKGYPTCEFTMTKRQDSLNKKPKGMPAVFQDSWNTMQMVAYVWLSGHKARA